MSRDSDFSHLGEILILAEDHGDVDALLLSNQDSVFGTVGQSHRLVPVAQGSRNDLHALACHRGELRHPEPVPPCVVRRFRETRVEANLARRPAIARADRPTQCVNVVVGIGAVKGGSGGMEEILAVNEYCGPLDWRLSAHAGRKNNPARGLSACPAGRKSRASIPARQTDAQAGRPGLRLTTGSRYVRTRSTVNVHYEIQAHSFTAPPPGTPTRSPPAPPSRSHRAAPGARAGSPRAAPRPVRRASAQRSCRCARARPCSGRVRCGPRTAAREAGRRLPPSAPRTRCQGSRRRGSADGTTPWRDAWRGPPGRAPAAPCARLPERGPPPPARPLPRRRRRRRQ